jgi:hypothetical protein
MSDLEQFQIYAESVALCRRKIGGDATPTMRLRFFGQNLQQEWVGSYGRLWVSVYGQPETYVQDTKVTVEDCSLT